ncbi:isochorismate synthase [Rathayibacter sp. VKM Ac-2878]|nr:isochorismate synthase [Rathayibacter sp. VKM Ac-2879]MBF4504449.1 isochorismate synthase [Rathayibacter sp. VKM Ac-2878]
MGAGARPLHAETTPLDLPQELLPTPLVGFGDAQRPLLWQRAGAGLAGYGEALRLEFTGPTRMRDAAQAWRELSASATVDDELELPGTGLVAFGAFAFSSRSRARSLLIVPQTVIGTRGGHSWLTRIAPAGEALPDGPVIAPLGAASVTALVPGAMTPEAYRAAVASAVATIRGGGTGSGGETGHLLEKVVLARELRGRLGPDADVRRLLGSLASAYPDCWTFAVDGFVGASPETLVSVDRGRVSARVLAGTAARGTDAMSDRRAEEALLDSAKDGAEHAFALASLLDALHPHTRALSASPRPFALELPNLWHLASDVEGTLDDSSSALDLVDALHPTAAVAGTPTAEALDLLDALEPFDRRRYAGPVGWIDGAGGGEWAVGLRSAEIDADGTITAWAGAGIVADSDPDAELAETSMKFRPMLDALG